MEKKAKSSEGSADSPKGTGGCVPGWDAAAERHDAQDGFHSAAQARAWAGGDFDADHGFAFDGVGRPAHWSRARGLTGVEAAALRAPLLCISLLHTFFFSIVRLLKTGSRVESIFHWYLEQKKNDEVAV
jgi:hypothetical protein